MHIIRVLTLFLLSTSAPFCNSDWQTSYLPLIAASCRAVFPSYTQQQTVITCTTNWYMYIHAHTHVKWYISDSITLTKICGDSNLLLLPCHNITHKQYQLTACVICFHPAYVQYFSHASVIATQCAV